jgi:hypothetical protein
MEAIIVLIADMLLVAIHAQDHIALNAEQVINLEQATVARKITAIIAVFLMGQANITHAVRVVGENNELFIDCLFV